MGPGGSVVKNPPANTGDTGSISGSGRSPGGGHDNPFQYSRLENPMDRGTWWATVHKVAKSQTQLSDWAFSSPPREVPLAFAMTLVWWHWILFRFWLSIKLLFLHWIWMRDLLGSVFLVVGSSFPSLQMYHATFLWSARVSAEKTANILKGVLLHIRWILLFLCSFNIFFLAFNFCQFDY